MSYSARSPEGSDDDPDLTNFIDLMVLLVAVLMIMMPAYAALAAGMATDGGGGTAPPKDPAALLAFDERGSLTLDGSPVSRSELEGRLQEIKRACEDQEQPPVVAIQGHRNATYGLSTALRGLCQKTGFVTQELVGKEDQRW